MKKLLYKEMKLAASPLSYWFILGACLTLVPSYPILLGAFFTTLGIFYSFQSMRENSDISYSLLLPVAKADIVKGKFAFAIFVESISFCIMTIATIVRMTVLKDAAVYKANALMGANLVFLGYALLIFAVFHILFISGFFKTAYYFGKPFVTYCVACFLIIVTAETLYHIPGLAPLNAFGFQNIGIQLAAFLVGVVAYVSLTALAISRSVKSFEKIDL